MGEGRKSVPKQPPAGGWGALNAVERHLGRQKVLLKGNRTLLSMNKPDGFDCPSCAWPDPKKPHIAEYCENGAKAVAWEATKKRTTPEFFSRHTVEELKNWSDFALEDKGRLTHPMRYDPQTDKYEPVDWETAFREIGGFVRQLDPKRVELYTSGRTSNEAAFLWQLYGRLIGTNNFPDCSNMCHETTTVALPESIGVGKGTVTLGDWEECDAVFILGQNPGTNSPRMMGYLHDMAKRGIPIVTFNPLKERALVKFTDPQSPIEMLTGTGQTISSSYFQLRTGGDIMAMQGMCKAVIAADDAARATGGPRILDVGFIAEHTHGFKAFADYVRGLSWEQIERYTALTRQQIEQAADIYMKAERVIACWGIGITQHRRGGDAMQQIVNLLLLRGNIGRPGTGACPIRGHSNVQGDRTVGIYQKPKEPFLAKLDAAFGFHSPREGGHDTAECCEAVLRGEVDAFLAMGGNFFRAIPDIERVGAKVPEIGMTVHVATKLNRSHLIHGKQAYILPALGRTELDIQNGNKQTVTVEDSFSMVHGSTGMLTPASEHCRSEPWIIAGLAKATVADRARIDWDLLVSDYSLIRDKIEAVLPEQFADYNARIKTPGGFRLPNGASVRKWDTPTGKANFLFKPGQTDQDDDTPEAPHLQLMTLRSHDQFNTTVYSYNDRYRGVSGERLVVFMNEQDIAGLGLSEGAVIEFTSAAGDGIDRRVGGFKVVAYDVPQGCCAAYYPETNALLPLSHRDERSNTPAAKSVPVRISAARPGKPVSSEPDVAETYPDRPPLTVPTA
ncbi:FdhF/YdeP family oxidoreductase [Microvirga lotononidis]|uniref:Molybdopterin-dependent oxidoreductase alpha subunit n=1 Tax=Microvirga lotononidis TaxID=864069 RepID=I4YV91_9HYPH|nr:FdhF/YdeP family oxidoreductase [Microvirga lotononidis]EIM27883.1 molybdopterin-dependent oxidoreductase alpha subunit [Microvirga lotononidis]WQO27989.1 FdhF/YdeP family oxidoreductase [Microvirga lotononidis]